LRADDEKLIGNWKETYQRLMRNLPETYQRLIKPLKIPHGAERGCVYILAPSPKRGVDPP
jgi:hypothetical protein